MMDWSSSITPLQLWYCQGAPRPLDGGSSGARATDFGDVALACDDPVFYTVKFYYTFRPSPEESVKEGGWLRPHWDKFLGRELDKDGTLLAAYLPTLGASTVGAA